MLRRSSRRKNAAGPKRDSSQMEAVTPKPTKKSKTSTTRHQPQQQKQQQQPESSSSVDTTGTQAISQSLSGVANLTQRILMKKSALSSGTSAETTSNSMPNQPQDVASDVENEPAPNIEAGNTSASDSDNDDENSPNQPPNEEPVEIVWLPDCEFDNRAAFDAFLQNNENGTWSLRDTKRTTNGKKMIMRCNRAPRKGTQCDGGLYALIGSIPNSEKIFVYRKNLPHNHDNLPQRANQITQLVKEKIIELHKTRHKPKAISYKLNRDEDIRPPTINQIKHTIAEYNREKYGSTDITLNQLVNFMRTKMQIPEDDDEAFVLGVEHSGPEVPDHFFRVAISTKRLLRFANNTSNVHCDSTQKIVVQNYPLLVAGCSDKGGHFHLLALVFASHETALDYEFMFQSIAKGVEAVTDAEYKPSVLVADAAAAIGNGFRQAFSNGVISIIIMCYFHVVKNFHKFPLKHKENRDEMKKDIQKLHLAYTDQLFDIASDLFIEKWEEKEPEFTRNFRAEYLNRNRFWYVGAGKHIEAHKPLTNNCLERFNGTLKMHQTFYQRMQLNVFKHEIFTIVGDRSRDYRETRSDCKRYQLEPEVPESFLKAGYEISQIKSILDHKEPTSEPTSEKEEVKFYMYAGENLEILQRSDICRFLKHRYQSFDDFASNAFQMYEITFGEDDWKSATCTCPHYNLRYICKHVIGVAYWLELIPPPEEEDVNYGDIPLQPRKRAGRPKKVTAALIID